MRPTSATSATTARTDDVIAQTVRALRGAHQVDAAELARLLRISRQSFYNRLNGASPWLASEVAALAQFFGCSIQDMYEGNVRMRPGAPFLNPDSADTGVPTRGYGAASAGRRYPFVLVSGGRVDYVGVGGGYGSSPGVDGHASGRSHPLGHVRVNHADSA